MILSLLLSISGLAETWVCPQGTVANQVHEAQNYHRFYCYNSRLERHGPYRRINPIGQTIVDGQYTNGVMSGHWIRYYENGKIRDQGMWGPEGPEGEWQFYFPSGMIKEKLVFQNGKQISISKASTETLYNSNLNKESQTTAVGLYWWMASKDKSESYSLWLDGTYKISFLSMNKFAPEAGVGGGLARLNDNTLSPTIAGSFFIGFLVKNMQISPFGEIVSWHFKKIEPAYGLRVKYPLTLASLYERPLSLSTTLKSSSSGVVQLLLGLSL